MKARSSILSINGNVVQLVEKTRTFVNTMEIIILPKKCRIRVQLAEKAIVKPTAIHVERE